MQKQYYLVRLGLLLVVLLIGHVGLVAHLYDVQVLRHEELYHKARQKYTSRRTQRGQRGRILDAQGNLLAGNLACRDILAEPRRFRSNRAQVIATLSRELGVRPGGLARRFAQVLKPESRLVEVVVERGVDIRVSERISGYHFPGIRACDTYRRYYPKGSLLANILGFTDHKGCGVSGIEGLLEESLRPKRGRAVYERDRRGNPLANGLHREEAAEDGCDVYLTILEPVQQIVEDELDVMVETHRPRAAYAVMADPRTGSIMALAQYPTFDANNRDTMENPDHWRNRIFADGFEPGSVMKCVTIAGALDYGTVDLETVFDCEHGYWFHCGRPLRDSGHQYDDLAVWEIVQKSSNIGTAKIALQMGPPRLYQTLSRFGFGRPTGVGFDNEASGIFRPLHRWDGLSITRFPIGQGVLVTPLQLVQAYSALANDGVVMQLHLVDRIVGADGRTMSSFVPYAKGRAVRPAAARTIVQAMTLVTRPGGTAPKAAVPGYDVAGKTGTAQKWVHGSDGQPGHYSHSRHVASFIGFVPAQDPAFVLLVVADEPSRGGHYGGTIAAPAFSRIAEKTLRYLQVAPTEHTVASLSGYAPEPMVGATERVDPGDIP